MKKLSCSEIDEILTMRISDFIFSLPNTQLKFEPFSNLSLSEKENLRAKFCLYIYNLCYTYYIVNLFFKFHKSEVKPLLDLIHKKFREKLDLQYEKSLVVFKDLIVIKEEQNNVINSLNSLNIDFTENTKTTIRDIFDFIYDLRYPVYQKEILNAKRQMDSKNPFYELSLYFTNHLFGKKESKFAYDFSIYTNIRTMNIIYKYIKDNIEDLYE